MAAASTKRTKSPAKPKTASSAKKRPRKLFIVRWINPLRLRVRKFLARRPHRSFRLTRRRDYVRGLHLPGYVAFTKYVMATLWDNKRIISCIVLLYAALTFVFVGFASQDTYKTLSDTLRQTSGDIFNGSLGKVGEAGLLLITGVSGNFSSAPTDIQRLYSIIIALLVWLTTVWTLRSVLAGQQPRFRDALYTSGAPIVSTFMVLLVTLIQLVPAALALLVVSAGAASGFISSGVEAMLAYTAAGLLFVLSLYWVTSSILALVVVTLPGKYPMQAIRTAGDLVIGRRLRILLRLVWMAVVVAITWAVIVIPIILLDGWIKSILPVTSWMPVVPIVFLVMSSLTVVFTSTYVYLLYRKVVDDDAKPA